MKTTFYGSQNTRFLLGVEGREIFLQSMGREIWHKSIPYANYEIIGVGNNGKAVIKADEGIVIYPASPHEEEYVLPDFEKSMLQRDMATIGRVVQDNTGERLCIEKISFKSKLSEKIFSFLSSASKSEKSFALHELVFYEISTRKQIIFYKFNVDRKIPHSFVWNISPDFFYIIWGEAQKIFKGFETKFSVANVRNETIFDQFVLEGNTQWILYINNFGYSVIDAPQKRKVRELLVSNMEGEKFKITVANEYGVIHLGRNFITFQSRMESRIVLKRFDNSIMDDIDLSAVEELQMEYQLLFNERDDVNFVVKKDNIIKVVNTNIERLPIDARRWQMMAEQQKIDRELQVKRDILESKEKNLQEQRTTQKQEELSLAAQEHKESRIRVAIEELSSRKEQELEKIQYEYLSGRMSKYDYLKSKRDVEMKFQEDVEKTKLATPREISPPAVMQREIPVPGMETTQLPYTAEKTRVFEEPSKIPPVPISPPAHPVIKKEEDFNLQEALQQFIPTITEKSFDDVLKDVDVGVAKDSSPKKKVPHRIEFLPEKKFQEKTYPTVEMESFTTRELETLREEPDEGFEIISDFELKPPTPQKTPPREKIKLEKTDKPEKPEQLDLICRREEKTVRFDKTPPKEDDFDLSILEKKPPREEKSNLKPIRDARVDLQPIRESKPDLPQEEDSFDLSILEEKPELKPIRVDLQPRKEEKTNRKDFDLSVLEEAKPSYITSKLPPLPERKELTVSFPDRSQSETISADQNIDQLKKQLQREVQLSIGSRKPSRSDRDAQIEKFRKLLEDLEESFAQGGISQENYERLKEKYESKINKLMQ